MGPHCAEQTSEALRPLRGLHLNLWNVLGAQAPEPRCWSLGLINLDWVHVALRAARRPRS